MGHFASWAAMMIAPTRKILLIAENMQRAQEAYNRLIRVGLTEVIGYSLANEAEWREERLQLASISIKRCDEIVRALRPDPSMQPIDVRSRAEWLRGHLPGAISLPLLDLGPSRRPINLSKPSLVYCNEGSRATTAASILLQENGGAIDILIDGIEGWSALGLPLETQDKPSSS
jgi:hydroxyacylglutathione hydrolase